MKLQFRDVAVGYEAHKTVQRSVNFSVEGGEVCCVLGPNGCGKTTLVKTLLGILPLQGGRITIDGEDISTWNAQRLSETIAYVAQKHTQPFPYLVKDVVMMGRTNRITGIGGRPSRDDYNAVENAMAQMGIRHLRDVAYVDISGGELQLVMFARALAQEPQLLVLDEPTSALDYGNAVRVIEAIRGLADMGLAVLMVTHNPDHAFMTGANVALLTSTHPVKFGSAFDIITRENIQQAYGVKVKLVEFVHDNNEVMRMCAPEFGGRRAGPARNDEKT